MRPLPWHMWVALGVHAQALVLRDPERVAAVLHWAPEAPAEENGELVVADAGYLLVAIHDPRDQLAILDASDGAAEPTRADWPLELLTAASQAYFEHWRH